MSTTGEKLIWLKYRDDHEAVYDHGPVPPPPIEAHGAHLQERLAKIESLPSRDLSQTQFRAPLTRRSAAWRSSV